MKRRTIQLPVICIISILIFITGCFFVKNRFYKNENRALLLQNDSIISENIELKEYADSLSKPVSDNKRKVKFISR